MRTETLEQILKVISIASDRYELGEGINNSYQYAVNKVSDEYHVAYQTIGDACRRRLNLNDIKEFKVMLKSVFDGNPNEMRAVLERNISRFDHEKIIQFFDDLKKRKSVEKETLPQKLENEKVVPYTIKLRKADSDILMALAQLLGRDKEGLLVEIVAKAVKERMKQTVNRL